jgi:hypothetical protein
LPNTIEQIYNGKWTKETLGGRRVNDQGQENIKWCINPQYFLNITQPTHVKIILRRKRGGGRGLKFPLGLCFTKSKNPVDKPSSDMVKVGKDGKIPGYAANDPRIQT